MKDEVATFSFGGCMGKEGGDCKHGRILGMELINV